MGRPRAGCWEVRGGHWDRYWELGCGEWGLVGPLFLKAGPGVSGFRPLVKERTERLTLLFHDLSRCKFAAEERMLGVVTLQDGVFTWFWWGEWWDPWWHQRPCAVQRRVHLKTPVASWSFREETMLAYLGFKSMKIPACLSWLTIKPENSSHTIYYISLVHRKKAKEIGKWRVSMLAEMQQS